MRSTERFTGLANVYGQARPTYPQELVRWCLEQTPNSDLIVDLGCGTGISTRLFASTGHPVVGIDPNAEMLATARAEGAQDYRGGMPDRMALPARRKRGSHPVTAPRLHHNARRDVRAVRVHVHGACFRDHDQVHVFHGDRT